uniref:Uncharacterized protein n=1 Tax=Acrobeloides nanus TaxID=290746 RepID=A0A914CTP8_9BILA
MLFLDNCLDTTKIAEANSGIPQGQCSGPCVEATYLINGIYAIVRGCYATLMQGTSQSISINSTGESCLYYTTKATNAITNTQGGAPASISGPVTVAVRFCNSIDNCNALLSAAAVDSTKYSTGDLKNCQAQTSITCYACSHFINGKCTKDPSATCQGSWCTKVEGKINGEKVVTRGCAPINPLTISDQFCVPRNVDTAVSQIGSNLTLSYDATQCFCNKDRCNGVESTVLSLGAIVMSIILLSQ